MKRIKFFLVLTAILIFISACATTGQRVVIEDEPRENLDGNLSVEEITGEKDKAQKDSSGIDATEKNAGGVKLIPDDIKKDFYDFKSRVEEQITGLNGRVGALEETAAEHGKRLDWLDSKIAEANDNADMNEVKGHYIFLPPFENNKYEITEEQKKVLNDFIARIEAGEFIAGENIDAYASLIGGDDYNIWISQKRADNTAAYFAKGLGPEKAVPWKPAVKWKDYFTATGHGKTEKYGDEKYNRRVRLEKLTQK